MNNEETKPQEESEEEARKRIMETAKRILEEHRELFERLAKL